MENVFALTNVQRIGEHVLRRIFLDANKMVCQLSSDVPGFDKPQSYQLVNVRQIHYRVVYDYVTDEIVATEVLSDETVNNIEGKLFTQLLDACGLGLLAWLTSDRQDCEDIRHYVDPHVLNSRQVIDCHMLDKLFNNTCNSFIQSVVRTIQEGSDSDSVVKMPDDFEYRKIKHLVYKSPAAEAILSARVKSIANRRTVRPRYIYNGGEVPDALPIAYYKYGARKDQHVKSSIYMLDHDGVETIVNLDEYVSLLEVPVNWFTSIFFTLPPNLKQVVHVVHRPFISEKRTENKGSVITVYTC